MSVLVNDGPDSLLTTAEAANTAGVTVTTIRSWVNRGHLEAAGLNERGHPLYRLLDVAKAEAATRDHARRTWHAS